MDSDLAASRCERTEQGCRRGIVSGNGIDARAIVLPAGDLVAPVRLKCVHSDARARENLDGQIDERGGGQAVDNFDVETFRQQGSEEEQRAEVLRAVTPGDGYGTAVQTRAA